MIPEEIFNEFRRLVCELSPENLYCDGEISQSQAQVKYKNLMREWLALEKKLGRSVSEDEIWETIIQEGM